jgi:hypothetical protein
MSDVLLYGFLMGFVGLFIAFIIFQRYPVT